MWGVEVFKGEGFGLGTYVDATWVFVVNPKPETLRGCRVQKLWVVCACVCLGLEVYGLWRFGMRFRAEGL